jgi:putative redox protein
MNVQVIWKEKMSFSGIDDSGFVLPLGTNEESGGNNDGFRPLELLLIGLAGCTGMDVISILEKKRQQVTGFNVSVHAERATDHPRVFTKILMEYCVTGIEVDPDAVQRAVELSNTKYCSAQAMLGKVVPIDVKIKIEEAA